MGMGVCARFVPKRRPRLSATNGHLYSLTCTDVQRWGERNRGRLVPLLPPGRWGRPLVGPDPGRRSLAPPAASDRLLPGSSDEPGEEAFRFRVEPVREDLGERSGVKVGRKGVDDGCCPVLRAEAGLIRNFGRLPEGLRGSAGREPNQSSIDRHPSVSPEVLRPEWPEVR